MYTYDEVAPDRGPLKIPMISVGQTRIRRQYRRPAAVNWTIGGGEREQGFRGERGEANPTREGEADREKKEINFHMEMLTKYSKTCCKMLQNVATYRKLQ